MAMAATLSRSAPILKAILSPCLPTIVVVELTRFVFTVTEWEMGLGSGRIGYHPWAKSGMKRHRTNRDKS
jgi:hypothetical protein